MAKVKVLLRGHEGVWEWRYSPSYSGLRHQMMSVNFYASTAIPRYQWNRISGVPQSPPGRFGERKSIFPVPRIKRRSLGCAMHNIVIRMIDLPRLLQEHDRKTK